MRPCLSLLIRKDCFQSTWKFELCSLNTKKINLWTFHCQNYGNIILTFMTFWCIALWDPWKLTISRSLRNLFIISGAQIVLQPAVPHNQSNVHHHKRNKQTTENINITELFKKNQWQLGWKAFWIYLSCIFKHICILTEPTWTPERGAWVGTFQSSALRKLIQSCACNFAAHQLIKVKYSKTLFSTLKLKKNPHRSTCTGGL